MYTLDLQAFAVVQRFFQQIRYPQWMLLLLPSFKLAKQVHIFSLSASSA
jgi:hypothetical protein